jgi:hypothetical protein
MTQPSGRDRPLPTERAFVVQLHAEMEVAQGRIMGRVEHVLSGQAAHFATLEELLTFIERVLTSLRTEPPEEPGGEGADS